MSERRLPYMVRKQSFLFRRHGAQSFAPWLPACSLMAAILFAAPIAHAQSYTFTTLTGPANELYSEAFGINDNGQVVGDYETTTGRLFGFIYDISTGTYSTIAGPTIAGATIPYAYAAGINNSGVVAGSYGDNGVIDAYGYVDSGGIYTAPLSDPSESSIYTIVHALNDSGIVVGSYYSPEYVSNGFMYNGGIYTNIADPNSTVSSSANGINDSGVIVGSYATAAGNYGFVDNGGAYTTLTDPLSGYGGGSNGTGPDTLAGGINNSGTIVGDYEDALGMTHGFIYNGGIFTTVDDPNEVVSSTRGLQGTELEGINDHGVIVGTYSTANDGLVGFVAIPNGASAPEPGSGMLALLGILPALGIAARRRGRNSLCLKSD